MLYSDFLAVCQWWFTIFVIGIIFLPVTFSFFRSFFDKGYIFTKVIGLGIFSYLVFILGIARIVPFSQLNCIFILLILSVIFLSTVNKRIFIAILKNFWLTFLFEELIFFGALLFWAYIHGFNPDIHGLEKYMDYGFINSILRADYFPPKDMWFTPFSINYYYFGHFITAVVTKLSGIPSNITFNLMLSTVFAFCFTEAMSIGANLFARARKEIFFSKRRAFGCGILTAFLTTFAGNLHIIYAFFKAYPVDDPQPFWKLQFLPSLFPNGYWYPNATRYIFHTIHEFPIYSWVVADLHGHVHDIPFVLLSIALLLSIFGIADMSEEDKENSKFDNVFKETKLPVYKSIVKFFDPLKIPPVHILFFGFLLSVMYMTNTWDAGIYLLLALLIIFYIQFIKVMEEKDKKEKEEPQVKIIASKKTKKINIKKILTNVWFVNLVKGLAVYLGILIFALVLFTLPFNLFFKPFVSGIGVLCAPDFLTKIGKIGPFLFEANHCQHSYWWELVMLYGFFYFFAISFIVFLIKTKETFYTHIFVLLVIILATLLIILPEFVYVKDIYPAHYRANTMFKLVFQSFIMLSISSGFIISHLIGKVFRNRPGFTAKIFNPYLLFLLITMVLVSLVMTYPYLAITSYYGTLKTTKGLDGTKYLEAQYPTDYQGILWLNAEVKGQPVILEAQGDSYTDYARVSANTGLPTVLGWTVHEWLWRGTYDIPAPRINDVKLLYETKNLKIAKDLIDKYSIKYVFIGALEYQKYPTLDKNKFAQLGRRVFQQGTTEIYQLNP